MRIMYKFFLLAIMSLVLVACGGNSNSARILGADNKTINVGDTFDRAEGVTAMDTELGDITEDMLIEGDANTQIPNVYEIRYSIVGSDGKEVSVTRRITVSGSSGTPTTITIMHGAPYEVDPFHENFTGSDTLLRQQRQREVEARLNVRVVYRAFPASATWGPSRVQSIINAFITGTPLADIYWTTTDWTQSLASENAIVPINQTWQTTYGSNITEEAKSVGSYQGEFYAFATDKPTVDIGLYFNEEIINRLGVPNPTDLFLAGEWTWARFESWALQVQAALGDDEYVLGGVPAIYAESMIHLNGGELIDGEFGQVAFHRTQALATYEFLNNLWNRSLFEQNGAYDAGSPQWQSGNVVMHPGSLWFLNADNRWRTLSFRDSLGFVPYPVGPSLSSSVSYVSPVSGLAVYTLANQGEGAQARAKEELAFQVWNELQLWRTDEEFEADFEINLIRRFSDEKYVEAYMRIFDKTKPDLINAIGISRYGANGWVTNANQAVREGSARSLMEAIRPIYESALEEYFGSQ